MGDSTMGESVLVKTKTKFLPNISTCIFKSSSEAGMKAMEKRGQRKKGRKSKDNRKSKRDQTTQSHKEAQ